MKFEGTKKRFPYRTNSLWPPSFLHHLFSLFYFGEILYFFTKFKRGTWCLSSIGIFYYREILFVRTSSNDETLFLLFFSIIDFLKNWYLYIIIIMELTKFVLEVLDVFPLSKTCASKPFFWINIYAIMFYLRYILIY